MNLSRRDFLKALTVLSAGSLAAASLPTLSRLRAPSDKPNLVILVLDALTARNLSVYGYARQTTPNLDRLAARATVYHSHYSAGNFTTPGTASMLTGLLPWTHRGINLGGLIHEQFVDQNIFSLLQDEYFTAAFTQNYYAEVLLGQFRRGIDRHIISSSYYEQVDRPLLGQYFPNDPVPTYYGLDDFVFSGRSVPSSPFFAFLASLFQETASLEDHPQAGYPYGLPNNFFYSYRNDVAFAGIQQEILNLAQQSPFFGYFHMFSPHEPYRPRQEFVGKFPKLDMPFKKPTKFSTLDISHESIQARRMDYDEYVADVDSEIGKLVDGLSAAGVMDNTCFIITSDHGEMFERGEYGHITRLLYDAVIHIPLLVLVPGQTARTDVTAPTSSLDLVPTLLHLAGKPVPAGLVGRILPGLGGTADSERSILTVEAKENSSFGPLIQGTISLIQGHSKLIHYMGYPKKPETFELYNLQDDPEEMKDLFEADPSTASSMKEELLDSLADANRPFVKNQPK
jgi:arylsulfatase A-like enzyme